MIKFEKQILFIFLYDWSSVCFWTWWMELKWTWIQFAALDVYLHCIFLRCSQKLICLLSEKFRNLTNFASFEPFCISVCLIYLFTSIVFLSIFYDAINRYLNIISPLYYIDWECNIEVAMRENQKISIIISISSFCDLNVGYIKMDFKLGQSSVNNYVIYFLYI